jgi:heavy metal sensor kinase
MNPLVLRNIRARLTLWNILVFGGILVVYAFGTSWFFLSTLSHQLDDSLKEDLELVDQMLAHLPEAGLGIDTHEEETGKLERFLEIWSTEGQLRYRSKTLGDRVLGGVPDSSEIGDDLIARSIVLSDGTHLRIAAKLHLAGGRPKLIRLAVNEAEYFADIHKFVMMLLLGIPLALLLIALSAYWMARNALTPVDLMASRARRISGLELKERIPIKNPRDELGRLAAAFNELLERVEGSFERLKRFTSDASHELRTPLTAMQSVGEVGLQTAHTPEEYREVIGSMLEESSRLTRLVDSLLFLSRADVGKHVVQFEQIDLLSFSQETAGLLTILAEEKGQNLTVEGQPGVVVAADRSLLSQALLNVVDNAIKFSPSNGTITLKVGSLSASEAYVDVSDSGPGIPPTERERIFERFYTLPTRNSTGTGLGLAIARWAIEANSGTIIVESANGPGSTFRIALPLQHAAP